MMGRGVGGRARSHSEYSPRFEERERRSGWGVAPSSRHLWVGNLSPDVTQNMLSEQFLRFGDLENISYIPGRNYAFVNYKKEEDAVIALRGLQGFIVAGLPLRVEFAKGDRASVFPRDEESLQHKDGRHATERGESLTCRDTRLRPSPEKANEKSKSNRSSEPSEMLWIGFPSFMNVDEIILRRAFSPFGEIKKVFTFPGRCFAFVRFRSIVEACRAKEALQGKLFNNPRVSICFARSDYEAEQGRGSTSGPFPPSHLKPNFHPGPSNQGGETFNRERSFESPIGREFPMASPGFMSNFDGMPGDANIMGFGRNTSIRTGPGPGPNFGANFEQGRFQEFGSERRMAEDPFNRNSPVADRRAPWHDFSYERPQRLSPFEDPWGEDNGSFPLAKKLKMEPFPDNELPEYPFSDLEQEKRNIGLPKLFAGLPEQHNHNRSFESVPFSNKGVPDHSRNFARLQTESEEPWRTTDSFGAHPGQPLFDPVRLHEFNSEPHHSPPNKEWKWEGTIVKGGTAVCRARCFPVGKVLDFMLPELLNCTARTGLDMLAKHYYQAASTWVVFFVPGSDADISFYNEFMHYLGEKQRAAVAKLGEKVTLFLVPPSDFSEQVLKVPGKVSISGVILKFQQPSSSFSSLNNPLEVMEPRAPSLLHRSDDETIFHGDAPFAKKNSPDFRSFSQSQSYFGSSSGYLAPVPSTFPPPRKPGDNNLSLEKVPDFRNESSQDQLQDQNASFPPNWSNSLQISSSRFGPFPPPAPNASSRPSDDHKAEEYPLANSRVLQGMTSSNYTADASSSVPLPAIKFSQQQKETKPQVSSTTQLPLQPEQLAQLAALLGQQKQSGKPVALLGANKQLNMLQSPSLQPQASLPQAQVSLPQTQVSLPQVQVSLPAQVSVSSGLPRPQISQGQQLHQQSSSASAAEQPMAHPGQQNSQQALNSSQETEADPQKRLQATLQLAAALLQQIQQQAKN